MTTATIRIFDRMPSAALRRFAWGVLAFFVVTILWGAVVRATGSGNGCGDHWPLCNGTVWQQSPTLHTLIELTHRVSAGAIDSVLVITLIVWTWRRTMKGHLARWAAGATLFLTVTEGALGAVLVKFGLTAGSRSPMRAPRSSTSTRRGPAACWRVWSASAEPATAGRFRSPRGATPPARPGSWSRRWRRG